MSSVLRLCFVVLLSSTVAAFASGDPNAEAIRGAELVAKKFFAALDAHSEGSLDDLSYVREVKSEPSGRVLRRPIMTGRYVLEARKPFGRIRSRTLVKTELTKDFLNFAEGSFVRFTYAVRYEKRETETKEILTIKSDSPQRWSVMAFSLIP